MNKRIRELLAQCTQESIDGLFANPYVDQEKFAELLVRECIQIVNVNGSNLECEIVSDIKKHFGVEE